MCCTWKLYKFTVYLHVERIVELVEAAVILMFFLLLFDDFIAQFYSDNKPVEGHFFLCFFLGGGSNWVTGLLE